jgi:hypothetical protein
MGSRVMPWTLRRVAAVLCLSLVFGPARAFAQANVATQHNDAARTGANTTETLLTTTNVNVSQFGKLFERVVDDEIYAQPLYVEGVSIPGLGLRNVVYVATNSDSVYAFDADDKTASAPLWRVNYTNPAAGIVPVSRTDVGQACGTYVDFAGNIGIAGTPAIDAAAQTMFFVARTKENGTFVQRLHALDIRTGAEQPGSPRLIQATVVGSGDGRDAQNTIAFNARTQNQRSGLLLDHGTVYITWASYCDQGPYHGWILGYDAATLQQVMVYNTTPDGGLGGIWQSGGGLSADAAGNLYALTGNGSFNGDSGGRNFGNSFLKVSPSGTLLDWFTPFNWSFLNATDEDLGIQNALLVPNTNLVVGGGKEGVMYVVNAAAMGHFRSADNGQIVQSFQASSAARMNASPVYWNSTAYGPAIYLWPAGDPLKVFRLVNGLFQTPAAAQSTTLAATGMPGGMLSVSANGSAPGTGIVWAAMSNAGDANHTPQPGIVRAYDAGNVTRELWNSQQNAARDALGNFSKFSPPTIADGKVFVPTLSNKLVVYGLIGPSALNAAPTVSAGADQHLAAPGQTTLTATASDDGNPSPPARLTTTWTLVSGPAAVAIGAPGTLTTTVDFPVAGAYTMRISAFDGEATTSDDVAIAVDPPAGSGTGLLGQYFNDAGSGVYFTALAVTRTDPAIDFDWASGSPDVSVQADNFSVRWSGQLMAPVTATYTFTTTSDEGVRFYVNGLLVIDNWASHTVAQNSGSVALTAGQRYDLRIDYFDASGPATVRLQWAYPGQTTQVVPQWVLYPALPVNQPPAVDAGPDQTVLLPNAVSLTGVARDDGLPSAPSRLTTTWSKISGREDSAGGTVVFADPNSPATTASFGADGIYVLRLTANDGAVTVSDDVTITVNPAPIVGAGTGLLGEYFNDPNNGSHFVTFAGSRIDPTVDFDWVTAAPVGGVTSDNFSVRWTGFVQAPVTGSFTFTTIADDGVRLWVNGQLVVDNWVDQAATTRTGAPIAFAAGVRYAIRMEYFEHTGNASAKLRWSYPGQALAPIPAAQLYPATNRAPVVNAGADRTITLPATTTLAGTASDDGQPSPPAAMSFAWSTVSGPGTVTFSNAAALGTTASFSAAGVYTLRLSASDSALTTTDDVVVTVNAANTPGLVAQYFNDSGTGTHFGMLALTRVDPAINFTWSGAPAAGVTPDNFSVRWSGRVQAPVSGTFKFSTVSDDGIRVWVNGQLVINNWTDHSPTTNTSAAITLTAGVRYTLTVEFYDHTGGAQARLQWSYPGQATQAIPPSRLFQ